MMDFANGTPPSQSQMSTLTRAEKALVKRNVHRPNLMNTPALYLDENTATSSEAQSKKEKSQPRGYAFWALVFALSVITLANFFLTITIFSVLRLTKSMEGIEVVPSSNLLKFFGEFEMNKLIKADGLISGFNESPVTITSLGSDLNMKVRNDQESEIKIGLDRVEFLNVDSFEINEPGKIRNPKVNAFSTIFPNFGLPKGVQRLHIKKATANRITSGLTSPLLVRSENTIRLKGNEGVSIRGKEILIRADQDLLLRSINGSVTMDATPPVVSMGSKEDFSSEKNIRVAEYKLCICMPTGQLFRIPVLEGAESIHCDSVDLTGEDNPCT
nr:EOG090X0F7H [Eurycercus lamellatus]